MIPDIGPMIAAYIVTRMVALLGQPSLDANAAAKILAALTTLVTLVCAADLLQHRINVPNFPQS